MKVRTMALPHWLIIFIGIIVLPSCAQPPTEPLADLGESSRLVKQSLATTFTKYTFEEVALEDGTAVLLNDLGAYWVKDGKVFALNGLAASYSPGLDYGPAGMGIDTVRSALGRTVVAQKAAKSTSPEMDSWKNPTMGDLHEILVPSGFLVGEYGNNLAWKQDDVAIYFEVHGTGNGQVSREVRVITLYQDGKEIASSNKIKVEDDRIYMLTEDQEWMQLP